MKFKLKLKRKKRPGAPEPHRNLGLTSGQQWLLLAAALAAAWFGWPPVAPTPPFPTRERPNWEGFLAVAYGGICDQPGGRNVTPERFREHMETLAAAGYRAISFDEARAFLLEQRPLPEKAILLTFDDGRKDTAEVAEAVLRRLRFPATFFLRLEPIDRSDRFFAAWPALRALAATGRWSFGAKGYRSFDRISTEAGREAGLFLTSYRWLPEESRRESDEEWESRVADEVGSTVRILGERIPGWKPTAFAFPCSDDGKLLDDGGERLRDLVSAAFPLAFSRTGYGFNHWRADLRRLTRLVVDPGWTGQDLLRWLDAQGARRTPFEGGSERDWVLPHGSLTVEEGGGVVLDPAGGRGAEAWLAGTEHWRCLRGRVTLETRDGVQAWLYLRAEPGREFLRLGCTGKRIELQTRRDGGEVHRLARGQIAEGAAQAAISFELTHRRIRFSVEGGQAPERSFPVPDGLDGGMVGLGVWRLGDDALPVRVADLSLEPRLAHGLAVESLEEVRALAGGARGPVDVIAPRWYRTAKAAGGFEPNGFELKGEQDPALCHLAAFQGASVWPVVSLGFLPAAESIPDLAARLDVAAGEAGAEGLILDLRALGKDLPDPELVKSLMASSAFPMAIIPARGVRDVLGVVSLEKLAWIAFHGSPPREVPPERILLLEEHQR